MASQPTFHLFPQLPTELPHKLGEHTLPATIYPTHRQYTNTAQTETWEHMTTEEGSGTNLKLWLIAASQRYLSPLWSSATAAFQSQWEFIGNPGGWFYHGIPIFQGKFEGKWSSAEFEFEEWHESKKHNIWFRTPARVGNSLTSVQFKLQFSGLVEPKEVVV